MLRVRTWVLAVAILTAALIAGCSSKQPAQRTASERQKPPKEHTVGISLLTEEHPFYRELKAALQEQCDERGLEPVILSSNMDLSIQTSQVENFITRGVDAIVLCPADSAGIAGAIRKANKAGIPVFTADIAAQGGDVVSHIASDNVAGGKLAGEYMVKLLKGKGNIAIINHPTVQSVQDRVKGFKDALAMFPEMRIVDDQAGQGRQDVAMTVCENILQRQPKLDGIFAINDNTALGALAAIKNSGREGIVVVGYDGDEAARQKILAGSPLKADAVQFPREIGKITADTVADSLAGKKVPSTIPVKVGIIDREVLLREKE